MKSKRFTGENTISAMTRLRRRIARPRPYVPYRQAMQRCLSARGERNLLTPYGALQSLGANVGKLIAKSINRPRTNNRTPPPARFRAFY